MINLITLSSPSGAGKSTLSHKLTEQYNAVRYSFDEIKCLRHSELIELITTSLKNGESVVADSLYSEVKLRKELLEAVKDIECNKICIYITTSLEECLRRNAKREGKARLPDWVIEHIYETFEPPTLDEGWDEILYY